MKKLVCALALMVAAGTVSAGEPKGYFYAIETTGASDRLYRIDWDGEVTPIGPIGGLGFPTIRDIVWDSNNEKLYGYDDGLYLWLRIDTVSGQATALGDLEFPTQKQTFNPLDGLIYAPQYDEIFMIDPSSGAIVDDPLVGAKLPQMPRSMEFGYWTASRFPGFYYITNAGQFWFVRFADWSWFGIGSNFQARTQLIWDRNTSKLYQFRAGSVNDFYEINQITGTEEETPSVDWEIRDLDIRRIAFVPEEVASLQCVLLDDDGDGDIDLFDFANVQNCFGAPAN